MCLVNFTVFSTPHIRRRNIFVRWCSGDECTIYEYYYLHVYSIPCVRENWVNSIIRLPIHILEFYLQQIDDPID